MNQRPDGRNPYRVLLRKYIDHVGECEGTTFITDRSRQRSHQFAQIEFTDEEWAELERLGNGGE